MNFPNLRQWLTAAGLWITIAAAVNGQTLVIDNDIQTYSTLSSTAVTVSGRSELRITAATAPISGSTINLTSPDSWFFLTNIRPSVVSSTYLGQVRVNGAAAVLNTNCRIVQFADGTVVIPDSPTFSPLQVFSGSHFTGTSLLLQNFTGYNDASLGALANQISSFKLKRGYTATIAQNANGTGASRNYVAQDGDIEVSVLPSELDDSISFVRVFPWRWTGKKGIAGNIASGLNVRWDYNWSISRNSTLDTEYVPIRQVRYWPGLGENWNTRGANHLLGYNEPDHADQADMTVGEAVYSWPDLLGTGLRVGSPAPSDGGLSWLYSFTDQADAANLRVDFVAVHYYRSYSNAADPVGATTQFYNYLKGVYDRVKRPLWVTEWNNGANWTSGPDPTAAQQQATIAKMIEMLDNTPFIERYALYNWVEDVRRVKWDDGSLTAAGVTYRDKVTPLSYQQVIPEIPLAADALYRFENDARDSSANGHAAILKGGAKFSAGHTGQAVTLSGNAAEGDYVQLSSRLGDSTDFTFGAWVYPTSSALWQRIFDLGSDTSNYMFLSPAAGSGALRFAMKDGGAEQQINHTAPLPLNTWTHVAVTLAGNTGKLFVNGVLVATNTALTLNPVNLASSSNYLGKSRFAADPLFAGKLDDVEFLSYALSDAKIAAMQTNTPPVFSSSVITRSAGTQGVAYSGTLAGSATDADAGDFVTYRKSEGPTWLTVAANGTLSGTPTLSDEGLQEFIIYATDTAGASALATLAIPLPSISGNGTWSIDVDGAWADAGKWTGGFPANGTGFTANFSALDITADRTVTLDTARTISNLQFGDASGAENWKLAAANGRVLTLAVATGSPSIAVNQNTATLTAALDGTAGLTKSGAGTLVLAGTNPLTGTLFVDANSLAENGSVRLASPGSATHLTAFQIRTNNTGSSTLAFDGTTGPVVTAAAAPIFLSGRTGPTPAIRNLAGSNTLAGTLTIQSGGGNYTIQSDAGTLALGALTSNAPSSARALTFQGTGNLTVNGVISNGTTTSGIALIKNGGGNLSLMAANTYTGPTSVIGGTLTLSGAGTLGPGAISLVSGSALMLNSNQALANTVTGAGMIQNTASISITGDFSGFTGSYTHNSTSASTAFNSATATSKNAAYVLASAQGTSQGFVAAGAGDYTLELGSLTGVTGSLFRGGSSVTGTTTLKIGNLNTADSFAGSISNGGSKVLAVTKTGTGTLTLRGANAFTGPTTVSAGKLVVDGTLSASPTSVAVGATLGGNGSIASATVAGKIAPGTGVGTLTASDSVTVTGTWEVEIEAASADRLNVSGALGLAGATLDFPVLAGGATAASYLIAAYGSITGTPAVMNLPAGYALDMNYNGQKQIALVRTATPFQLWAGAHSLTGDAAAPLADPDGDGVANSLEYFLGMAPEVADAAGLPTATNSATDFVFTFRRNMAAARELSSAIEISSLENEWSPLPAANITVEVNGTMETVTATIPMDGATKNFVRLKVW